MRFLLVVRTGEAPVDVPSREDSPIDFFLELLVDGLAFWLTGVDIRSG